MGRGWTSVQAGQSPYRDARDAQNREGSVLRFSCEEKRKKSRGRVIIYGPDSGLWARGSSGAFRESC